MEQAEISAKEAGSAYDEAVQDDKEATEEKKLTDAEYRRTKAIVDETEGFASLVTLKHDKVK